MKRFRIIVLLMIIILVIAMLYACNKPDIKVSFDPNGGNAVEDLVGKKGDKLTLPTTEKAHYVFEGWFLDDVKFERDSFPDNSVKLVAKWRAVVGYAISFNSNGGSQVPNLYAEEGSQIVQPENPVKEGYVFSGWFKDPLLTIAFAFDVMPSENITLYANWAKDPQLKGVAFYANNVLLKKIYTQADQKLDKTSMPDISDEYQFDGVWYDGSKTAFDIENTIITQDIELYAEFYSKGLIISNDTVIGFSGGENVIVPKNVVKVGDYAFANNTSIKTISFLSDNMQVIGEASFANCTALYEVNGIATVTQMGDFAFLNCKRLKAVDISGVLRIGDGVFNRCENLTEVKLNLELVQIGEFAFANCFSLKEISFGTYFASMGDYSLMNCRSLIEFNIPRNLSVMGKGALEGCTSLSKISVAVGNQYFQADNQNNIYNKLKSVLLFYQQTGKTEEVFEIPSSVTRIETNAFINNANLRHIIIPSSVVEAKGILASTQNINRITLQNFDNIKSIAYLYGANSGLDNGKNNSFVSKSLKTVTLVEAKEIPAYAFYGCSELTQIDGLANVQTIGAYAFSATTAFSSFRIGKGLRLIDDGAFEEVKLTSFIIDKDNQHFMLTEKALYNKTDKTLVKVLPAISSFDFVEEGVSDVKRILAFAFEDCAKLTSLTIPEGVEYIGKRVFQNCQSLTTLTLPIGGAIDNQTTFDMLFGGNIPRITSLVVTGSLQIIPNWAFANSQIISITLPATVKEIGSYAFFGCSFLEEIIGIENVVTINESAFNGTNSLKNIEFSNKLKTIGDFSFTESGLVSITIPKSLEIIGEQAFALCAGLTTVSYEDINASVLETIGVSAFDSSGLKGKLTLPSYLKLIDVKAFAYLEDLVEVAFEGSVVNQLKVAESAFTRNNALEKVTFPSELVSLGYAAFYYCGSLEKVDLGLSIKEIGSFAFIACTNLLDLSVPTTLEYVGQDILRDTEWLSRWLVENGNGFVYLANAAIAYRGQISSENLSFEQSFNGVAITTIADRVLEVPHPTQGGYYDYNIHTLTIPEGYKYISDNAFYIYTFSKSFIDYINLPSSLISIGDFAFFNNPQLKMVTIGSQGNNSALKSIGNYAFANCTKLTDFYLYKTIGASLDAPLLAKDNAGGITVFERSPITLRVPESAVSFYRQAWSGARFSILAIA